MPNLTVNAVVDTFMQATTQAAMRAAMSLDTGDIVQFSQVNVGHASDTTVSRLSAGQLGVEGATVIQSNTNLYDPAWIPALAMTPRTTNGADRSTVEYGTNDVMVEGLAFDTATEEGAGIWFIPPYGWDTTDIRFTPVWTAASGSGTVKFDIGFRSYANDDAIDQAVGTATGEADTLLATNDLHIGTVNSTTVSAASGTFADGNPVYMEVTRDVATDTLAADAVLIGVLIEFIHTHDVASIINPV